MRTNQEVSEWFWGLFRGLDKNSCWIWPKGKHGRAPSHNYGVAWINGKKLKTHRLAFELKNGPIPPGMSICHHCDNPPCCNPSHLFQGTHKDNMADCRSKGRDRKEYGEKRYNHKLTEANVREIRARFVKRSKTNGLAALGREFGVYDTMIHSIVTFKRWKHVKSL